jgi:predicted RNA-binding Zn-ribbon protein involved in translation (DUF1610 family)
MSIFDKILGSIFNNSTNSQHSEDEEEEAFYCDNCGSQISESEYFAWEYLCQDCQDEKHKDDTPYWLEEEEDYGQDADHNGVCDHCGQSKKYGNCNC